MIRYALTCDHAHEFEGWFGASADFDDVKKFLKEKPFPYPVLLDPEQTVATKLAVFALPTLLVVDKKGRVSYLQGGIADGDTLKALIKKAGS